MRAVGKQTGIAASFDAAPTANTTFFPDSLLRNIGMFN